MTNQNSVDRGKELMEELSAIVKQLPDHEFLELLGTGSLNNLLKAILDPSEQSNYPNPQAFLLAKKARVILLALLHDAVTHNYSFARKSPEGKEVFISPTQVQWFDDGVIFLQGEKRFAGLLGLYRGDGSLSYAIVARDTYPGEPLGPEHFEFIDEQAFRKRFPKPQSTNAEEAIQQLEALLNSHENVESYYQEWLIKYPWVLGAEYKEVQRHTNLDDKHIPDFTGIRVHDGSRDIIEIKSPFMKMFRGNGGFTADFNDALNQTEEYLRFAQDYHDYLFNKGFRFDNPKCHLIIGFNLTGNELEQVRRKERNNPTIHLRTYNDLLAYAKNVAKLLRDLK